LGQAIAISVLIAERQPFAAGVAGLLLLGQVMVQPGMFNSETEEIEPSGGGRFVRLAQPWLMAAMLVAVWGIKGAAG